MQTTRGNEIKERYTYDDYASWGEDAPRCEIIDGVIYDMSAPTMYHQLFAGRFHTQLANFLKGKKCLAFFSPFDVRLNYDTNDDIVVQPDVLVICDRSKIENGKHCLGAPDFIIEVISPSNTKHDTKIKYQKYLEAGVREYWIADPIEKTVAAHRLIDKQYNCTNYKHTDGAPVLILENCVINLTEVFEEI